MEGILVLLLIFPGTFAFFTCMALVDVVRFGRFKQLVEQCVVVERKEK